MSEQGPANLEHRAGSTADVLRAFADRDLAALVASGGLPAGVPVGEVASTWGADPGVFLRHFLGDPPRETFWSPAVVEGFRRVKMWFRDGVVVKLEGEWPTLDPAVADTLGEPSLELDHRIDVATVPGGELVWPGRGLALKLNRSRSLVVALSFFAATTPDEYRRTLRNFDDYRES